MMHVNRLTQNTGKYKLDVLSEPETLKNTEDCI
jgi:hypothetical protein